MWLTVILEALKLIGNGFELGKALAPTDAMKEKMLERKTKRLTADEYGKELKQLRAHIVLHPRQSVDAIVNLKCDGYDADDIMDFRIALYEQFPKRKHIKPE